MNEIPRKRRLSGSIQLVNGKLQVSDQTMKENIPPVFFTDQINSKVCLQTLSTNNECGSMTPKKSRQNMDEPVTPNTNFKLLTSLAATLDYATCGTPKSSRNYETIDNRVSCDSDATELANGKVNRKEKSLAIICTRFLSMYPIHPLPDKKIIVSLDEACNALGVERRRLYDIVNVFESIDILTKNAKNQYLWFGKNNLIHSLQKLKTAAVKENMLEKLQFVLKTECSSNCKQSCILNEVQNFQTFDSSNSQFTVSTPPELRREKSLGIMSQKFLMLFLVSPNKIISLGVAAKVLNGFLQKSEKGAQIKTQIRRLYDIANVLSSIGLIQKEVAFAHHGRKPAFKYIGPDLENCKDYLPRQPISNKSRSLIRHSSFQEICAVAEIEHQKLNLEESHNSAPPFDSIHTDKKENSKISFENLHLNDASTKSEIADVKPEVKPPLIMKPNLKVLNFGKTVVSQSMPCFILNSIVTEKDTKHTSSAYGTQTFLVINAVAPTKDVKVNTSQNQSVLQNQVSNPQTIQLSPAQRDAILQSLNISLSSEQCAAIHLDGSSSMNNNHPSNVLKIINKNSMSKVVESKTCVKNPSQVDTESASSGSVSVTSTRNNSPNSIPALDSPLSIPSGYVTPIPTASSDMTFVSNIEVNDILKKIESQGNFNVVSCKAVPSSQNIVSSPAYVNSTVENTSISLQKATSKEFIDKQCAVNSRKSNDLNKTANQVPQLISNDSCSNDSVNLEVCNIFKGKTLGDASLKPKPFLIDEKTILSPLKKSNVLQQFTIPSNLITPPYIGQDRIFVFSTPPSTSAKAGGVSNYANSVPNSVVAKKKILPTI